MLQLEHAPPLSPAGFSTEHSQDNSSREGHHRLLSRWRIRLSTYLFWGAIIVEIVCGYRPWDIREYTRPQVALGYIAILLGISMRSWAAGIIHKSTVLARTGPYLLTRHPLYLGSLLLMLGFCALIGHPVNLLIVLGPIYLTYFAAMRREEELIAARFPDAWREYMTENPILQLWRHPERLTSHWTLKGWWSNHEYRALCGTLLGLAGIRFWLAYPLMF